jgi:hypothetical protein
VVAADHGASVMRVRIIIKRSCIAPNATARGWTRTGGVFLAYPSGTTLVRPGVQDVRRYYGRPQAGLDSHFFSADPAECAQVAARWPEAWALETSSAFRIGPPNGSATCPPNTQVVHRAFNGRADANHRYFTDAAIADVMVSAGWTLEGSGTDRAVMCAPL